MTHPETAPRFRSAARAGLAPRRLDLSLWTVCKTRGSVEPSTRMSEAQAAVMGKPSEHFFEAVLRELGVEASDTVMVGDDLLGDVVIELVELHLPDHLAPLMPLLSGVNRVIHLTRRALAKQLFK